MRTTAAAFTHAPENAAYGLLAFAPLGAHFGPVAMGLAMLSAVAANAVATLFGGGRLVGGPRASLALLTTALVTALLVMWPAHPDTLPGDVARIVLLVALGIAGAGLLQVLFGALRLGAVVKYTPYPVQLGLASGVGLLLAWTAWPVMCGQGFGSAAPGLPVLAQAGPLAAGLAAAAVTGWATWRQTRLPPLLLGLLAGAAMHAALRLAAPASGWAAAPAVVVGTPDWVPGVLGLVQTLWGAAAPSLAPPGDGWLPTVKLLAAYALTVAVLASLDTLLATSVVDGRLRQWRDPNRELMAQGLATVAAAVAGAQAVSPSVARSLSLVGDGAPRRQVVLGYALVLLGVLALSPWLLTQLPLSVLGGVLFAQGLSMVSTALLRTPLTLLRAHRNGTGTDTVAPPGQLRAHWAVALAVVLAVTTLGVAPAVLIGAALAVLLFLRANLRDVVRATWHADERHSLKMRPAHCVEALQRHGRRIAVLELEGSLFFGTADALRARLRTLATEVDSVILDLRQVREIDVTGARILAECAADAAATGKLLLLAEWPLGDPRRQVLQAVAGSDAAALAFEDDADEALERAEATLLRRLGLASAPTESLQLVDTSLARGLDAAELATLAAATVPVRFARGEHLFHRGDPGDALYLCLAGRLHLLTDELARWVARAGAAPFGQDPR